MILFMRTCDFIYAYMWFYLCIHVILFMPTCDFIYAYMWFYLCIHVIFIYVYMWFYLCIHVILFMPTCDFIYAYMWFYLCLHVILSLQTLKHWIVFYIVIPPFVIFVYLVISYSYFFDCFDKIDIGVFAKMGIKSVRIDQNFQTKSIIFKLLSLVSLFITYSTQILNTGKS